MELWIIKSWIFEKKVTFGTIKFCDDIEVHSKREGMEIMGLHLKSCFIWCFLLNPLAILQICDIFRKSVTWHVTWAYKMPLSLKNVKDGEICSCAKFRFNVIIVARNIANKHFSLKKAPDPGLKVIPQYCIAHPYCARFLASLARTHSARILTTWRFLYATKPARE